MSPSEVRAARHRDRLLEGMVHVVSRHGYMGASVARVIEAAGVSRATFYEHFPNREECFLAAYREIAGAMRRRVRGAAACSSVAERPRVVLAELLDGIAEDPEGARLILIEAMGGGPRVQVEHEKLIADTEKAIELFLDQPRTGQSLPQLPAAALLGGVAGTLAMHVFSGAGGSVGDLLEGLLGWVSAYELPDTDGWDAAKWEKLGLGFSRPLQNLDAAEPAPLLPRGEGALSPPLAAEARRRRILAATARIVREKGYAGLNVAGIAATARVTRGVFYSQFRSKEEAFLAVQTVALRESIAAAAAEFSVAPSWPEKVWGGVSGLFGYLAGHPDLAHLEVLEAHAVGKAAILRTYDNRMAYRLFLEDGYSLVGNADPSRLWSEAIANAMFGLIRRQVVRGRSSEMLQMLPASVYVALAPFIGAVAAREFVAARAAPVPAGSRVAPTHPPVLRARG